MGDLIQFPDRRVKKMRMWCSTCALEMLVESMGPVDPCPRCGAQQRQSWEPGTFNGNGGRIEVTIYPPGSSA